LKRPDIHIRGNHWWREDRRRAVRHATRSVALIYSDPHRAAQGYLAVSGERTSIEEIDDKPSRDGVGCGPAHWSPWPGS
jgi:hypothetical protein